jgi:uncharacterized protein YceK
MKMIALLLSANLVGCASLEAANHVERGSPRFFAGMRLDTAAMNKDTERLKHFRRYGMNPPAYPRADMVPSAVADIVLFPVALGYTITEPLLYLD